MADVFTRETKLSLDRVAPENNELRHIYLLRMLVCLVLARGEGRPSLAKVPEIAESIRPVRRFTHVDGTQYQW